MDWINLAYEALLGLTILLYFKAGGVALIMLVRYSLCGVMTRIDVIRVGVTAASTLGLAIAHVGLSLTSTRALLGGWWHIGLTVSSIGIALSLLMSLHSRAVFYERLKASQK